MTAGSEDDVPDPQRSGNAAPGKQHGDRAPEAGRRGVVARHAQQAEIYLRLEAEAELRRALSFPRYRQLKLARYAAGSHGSVALLRAASYHTRASYRSVLSTAPASGPSAPARGSRQRVLTAMAGVRDNTALHVWHARAHLRARFGHARTPPKAQECLDRVEMVAAVLRNVSAIDDVTLAEVVGGLQTALAARSLIDHSGLVDDTYAPLSAGTGVTAPTAAAAGPMRAIPVGAPVTVEARSLVYLGTLILDARGAALTVTARRLPSALEPDPDDEDGPDFGLGQCTAVDDKGTHYAAYFSGGGDDERWDGTFDLHPVPAPSTRWIDVLLPTAEPVRIHLGATPPALPTTSTSLPDGAAGRYLDHLTLCLLLDRQDPEMDLPDEPFVMDVASVLIGAGLLAPDAPALRRLAAAARLLDLNLPSQLAQCSPGQLPDDWLVMLAGYGDGPVGVVPLAAQLPELEGVQCVITGIESQPSAASFQVHARGWPGPDHHGLVLEERFRWTARDDAGFLYLTDDSQGSYDDGNADMTLQLRPGLRSQARTLTITLTGPTAEVGVTVPLDWQETS